MTTRSTFMAAALAATLAATVAVPALAQDEDTSDKRVGFSNNYAANSWRQAMLKSWDELSQQVVGDGIVAAADVRTTAQNDATQQQQQISDMILEGYDAIVVNAASPEALNSVVEEACAQGIPVVSFDGVVTAECAYRVGVDFVDMGYQELVFLAEKLPEGGRLLEIRGLAGTSIDEQISEGIHKGVAEFPQFEIVGSVHGDWAQDVAQQAVAGILPSLPEDIVGVVTQGGDGFGAAMAFEAAGRPRPVIIMGNRQDELAWWKEQKDLDGYETTSLSIAPGTSTAAFWVAQQLLAGAQDIPHDIVVPYLRWDQDDFEAALAAMEPGDVGTKTYTLEEMQAVIEAHRQG
jgi:ribose transport system substrate-binding protein